MELPLAEDIPVPSGESEDDDATVEYEDEEEDRHDQDVLSWWESVCSSTHRVPATYHFDLLEDMQQPQQRSAGVAVAALTAHASPAERQW